MNICHIIFLIKLLCVHYYNVEIDASVALERVNNDTKMAENYECTMEALDTLDSQIVSPASTHIMQGQATINVGMIGHVAHGKSTVVRSISGVQTVRFKEEQERNITIKLGYANAKIYISYDKNCPRPECYSSRGSFGEDCFTMKGFKYDLIRHISFVDCPGHDVLMSTMLSGAAIMDVAILFIAANEPCPQPQTEEHLAAIEIMKLDHVIILQNKIDLVTEEEARKQHRDIIKFTKGTIAEGAPIIPFSAVFNKNVDVFCEYLSKIPVPLRDYSSHPQLLVLRSFDVNKPGTDVESLKGGVIGGSILKGVLKVGQEIEIRPGLMVRGTNGIVTCTPIFSTITSLFSEKNQLMYAVPGGLIGIGTNIDPTLCKSDRMLGQVMGNVGQLPDIYNEIEVSYNLFQRILGVEEKGSTPCKIRRGERLWISIGSLSTECEVAGIRADLVKLSLKKPVCTDTGVRAAFSRRIENHLRLIGFGEIRAGRFKG